LRITTPTSLKLLRSFALCWFDCALNLRALPDAEEVIAYKMPGFRIDQSIIAGYAAFSKQCGLYLSPSAIKSHADEIAAAGLKCTKTGVTFSPSQPIPDGLVKKLALASRRDQKL
jgi:uncharacterized protein YdhG (YjbR/CyaY superfamily)